MSFKNLFKSFLFSNSFTVVYFLVLTQIILTNFLNLLSDKNAYNESESFTYAFITLVVSLIFGGIIKVHSFYFFSNSIKKNENLSLQKFISKNFTDWVVVEVRAQVRVLIGLVLFILPGVYEAIRLSLSTSYVFLDDRMNNESFDPILESRNEIDYKSSYFAPLFLITFILPIVIALLFTTKESVFDSYQNLLFTIGSSMIQSLAVVLSYSYIVYVYLNLKNHGEV